VHDHERLSQFGPVAIVDTVPELQRVLRTL